MRKPFISANWKMHMTGAEAVGFLQDFLPAVSDVSDVDIVIAPPFTALEAVAGKIVGTNVSLSSQDVFYEEKGAYTGEISPGMLKALGCAYAIVGHSERRQLFGETDETVNKKIKAVQAGSMQAIFCIGESITQREAGQTNDVLGGQIEAGLQGVDISALVVAYEPIWAIGTGVTATTEQAQETHSFIRQRLSETFGPEAAEATRILYGGSVKPDNVDDIMACPDVDGALVGGASLKPDSFARLVNFRRSQ